MSKNYIGNLIGGSGMVVLFCLLICLAPMLLLWSVNTLAALGGSDFYIDHSLVSYWATFIFLIVMKSGKSSK